MTAFSLRLPEDLEARLNREAQQEGLPRSEIARVAIVEFLDRRERERFMAAFIAEARAAYDTSDVRREALEIAEEALLSDQEAFESTHATTATVRPKRVARKVRK